MDPDPIQTLADLERNALARVNKVTREYWAHGAGENITVRENATAFDQYRLRPRVLRNVSKIDMSTSALKGLVADFPIGIAPSGWHKMAHPDGEAATAAAARALGSVMGVSMGTVVGASPEDCCSPEEVKRAGGDSVAFFQLYMFNDRKLVADVLRRVEKAGYRAILLTVDTPYIGKRVSEIRNRPQLPKFLTTINFGTMVADTGSLEIDNSLVWEEILPWLRATTSLEIWLKGISTLKMQPSPSSTASTALSSATTADGSLTCVCQH